MSADGTVVKIDPGAVYVIEVDHHLTPEQAEEMVKKFEKATGARCVVFGPDVRLARATRDTKPAVVALPPRPVEDAPLPEPGEPKWTP